MESDKDKQNKAVDKCDISKVKGQRDRSDIGGIDNSQDKRRTLDSPQEHSEVEVGFRNELLVRKGLKTREYEHSTRGKGPYSSDICGKGPSISNLSGSVKGAGQKQTTLLFMSAGGASWRGHYKWAPD